MMTYPFQNVQDKQSTSTQEVSYHPQRYCPNCGRNIPFDAKICPYCGKNFETFSPQTKRGLYCSECGFKNSPTAKFCNECGKKLLR